MYQESNIILCRMNLMVNSLCFLLDVKNIRSFMYIQIRKEANPTDNKPVESVLSVVSMLPNLHIYNETTFKRMPPLFQEASQV